MRIRRLFSGIILAILVTLLLPGLLLAIGDPEGNVTINDTYVFRDVLEKGDQLYYVRYNVDYTSIPEERPQDTWQVALYDYLGNLVATRPLNYFRENIISVYLTPSQALGWGKAHSIKIMGMPSVFGNLTEGVNMRTEILTFVDYQEAIYLGGIMIAQAAILQTNLGMRLLASNTTLTAVGSQIFLVAIPGLTYMAPDIFEAATTEITPSYKDYDQTYREALRTNAGSKIDYILTDFSNFIRVPTDAMAFWLIMFGFMMLVGVIFSGVGQPGWAFIAGFPFIVGGAYLLGGVIFTMAVVITVVVAIIFGVYFILARFP